MKCTCFEDCECDFTHFLNRKGDLDRHLYFKHGCFGSKKLRNLEKKLENKIVIVKRKRNFQNSEKDIENDEQFGHKKKKRKISGSKEKFVLKKQKIETFDDFFYGKDELFVRRNRFEKKKKKNKVLKAERRLLKNKVFEMESELKNNKFENIRLRKELLLEKRKVKDLFDELIKVCKLLDEKEPNIEEHGEILKEMEQLLQEKQILEDKNYCFFN